MFGTSSPLSASFWTSPTKQTSNTRLKKGSDIDLKRLSIFNGDAARMQSPPPTKTDAKENDPAEGNSQILVPVGKSDHRDEVIAELMKELRKKDALIVSMQSKLDKSPEAIRARKHRLSQLKTHIIHDEGRLNAKLARSGSILTSNVLEAIADPTKTGPQIIAESLIKVFQKPLEHLKYLQSAEFANNLMEICDSVSDIFEDEPKVLGLQSPTYVIGDIHGNLEDLHFFADNIWKLGMDLTAGTFRDVMIMH